MPPELWRYVFSTLAVIGATRAETYRGERGTRYFSFKSPRGVFHSVHPWEGDYQGEERRGVILGNAYSVLDHLNKIAD